MVVASDCWLHFARLRDGGKMRRRARIRDRGEMLRRARIRDRGKMRRRAPRRDGGEVRRRARLRDHGRMRRTRRQVLPTRCGRLLARAGGNSYTGHENFKDRACEDTT
jgi:hypothetical protein